MFNIGDIVRIKGVSKFSTFEVVNKEEVIGTLVEIKISIYKDYLWLPVDVMVKGKEDTFSFGEWRFFVDELELVYSV